MKSNTYSTDNDKFLQRLSGIAKPPKLVHVMGKLPDDHRPCIAIVGSRKPTSYGKEVTFKLAYELAKGELSLLVASLTGLMQLHIGRRSKLAAPPLQFSHMGLILYTPQAILDLHDKLLSRVVH